METNAHIDDERRKFVRYTLKISAKLVFDDGKTSLGNVENISTGGVYMKLDYPVSEIYFGRKGRISINAIITYKLIALEADCNVVRVMSSGVGLLFESLDTTNKKILFSLIDELNRLLRESRTTGDTD